MTVMLAERIAPMNGYATDAKAAYRESVWRWLKRGVRHLGNRKVIILPSSEGLEIENALAAGVPIQNLVCIDKSAAVIATSKWRKRWPDLRFHAVEIKNAQHKLEPKSVQVANLDLCGRVSGDTVEQVRAFVNGPHMADQVWVAVTIAKGREDSALMAVLQNMHGLQALECSRMTALAFATGLVTNGEQIVRVHGSGTYVSGKHPMSWAVFHIEKASPTKLMRFKYAMRESMIAIRRGAADVERQFDRLVCAEVDLGFKHAHSAEDDARLKHYVQYACGECNRNFDVRLRSTTGEVDRFTNLRLAAWERVGRFRKVGVGSAP